jgi:hypothetical protein
VPEFGIRPFATSKKGENVLLARTTADENNHTPRAASAGRVENTKFRYPQSPSDSKPLACHSSSRSTHSAHTAPQQLRRLHPERNDEFGLALDRRVDVGIRGHVDGERLLQVPEHPSVVDDQAVFGNTRLAWAIVCIRVWFRIGRSRWIVDTLGAPNPVINIAHTHTIPRTIDTPTGDLSGGNLQKFVIAREDLDEVMELSDRFIVLLDGAIMGEVARADFDVHTIGLLMPGRRAEGHDEVATS